MPSPPSPPSPPGPTWTPSPKSVLDAPLRARLEAGEAGPPPPPPWDTVVSAVLWWHRATPAALARVRGAPGRPDAADHGRRRGAVPREPGRLLLRGLRLARPAAPPRAARRDRPVHRRGLTGERRRWPGRLEPAEDAGPGALAGRRTGPPRDRRLVGIGRGLVPHPERSGHPVPHARHRCPSSRQPRTAAGALHRAPARPGPAEPGRRRHARAVAAHWLVAGRHPCLAISSARMQITAPVRED